MSNFTSQEDENPVQVIKYVDLSRFQPILETLSHLCCEFVHLKVVYWWFLHIQICEKMWALSIFQIIDYRLNIDYVVLICAESDK